MYSVHTFYDLVSFRTTFSEFTRLHGRDERFRAIEKKREREAIFTDYLTELKKSSKVREVQQRHSTKSRTDRVRYLKTDRYKHILSLFYFS